MKALILAGGYATRLWPLTKERAKPLLLINGKPLLTHIIEKIPPEVEIYVATNHKFRRDFREWQRSIDRPVEIIIEDSVEEGQKLGAVGAVANFIKQKDVIDDLLVIAGDNFFTFEIEDFCKNFQGLPLVAAHNIKKFTEASKFGVLSIRGNRITNFEEKPREPKSALVSTGVYLLPSSVYLILFEYLKRGGSESDNFGSFIAYLIKRTEVRAYVFVGDWFDIGSFEGYLELHKQKRRVRKKKPGENGYYGVDFFGGDNRFSGSVFVDKGSFIENSTIIDSIIMKDCHLENSIVQNCIIDEGSVIVNSKIEYMLVESGSKIENRTLKSYTLKPEDKP